VREHAGLEPEEVARYVDVRPDHLRQMESGARPIPAEWVPELARILGVTSAHLLGEQRAVLETAAA
jgi:DNA-binding transcriptional regulator YdaS (Cro superfamily)